MIGRIYDAAINPDFWYDALVETCVYVRCSVGALYSHDIARREPTFHVLCGLDAHYTKLYLEQYGPINPLIPAHLAADAGDVLAASRLPIWNDFISSPFFTDWGGPQGFLDSLSAIVERTPTRLSMVSCIRHQSEGLVDDISFSRMALLRPHFLRAIKIGEALELRAAQSDALGGALNNLAAAVFIVDDRAYLAFSNAAGSALLREERAFRLAGRHVEAIDHTANVALAAALVHTRSDAPTEDRAPAIAIESKNGERYFAHVLPLNSGLRRQYGLAYSASAAIFVVRTSMDVVAATEIVRQEFGLTVTELRILRSVVEIGGVREIAASLKISEDTARTHLRHLFDKTNARSQVELVKLVADRVPPLRR